MIDFSEEEKQRYSRHLMLENFGADAQAKLKAARVLVVGAGGLGCPALLYLAAAGVGCIGIADNDVVSLSNLQRQVLYTLDDIGKNKATTAAKRLAAINQHILLNVITARVMLQNVLSIIEGYDIIIDATDNFSTRYLLNDACVIQRKPLVYGAIFKFEGQVSVFNLDDGPTYRCLFPHPVENQDLSCGEVGVLGVLPGIIGTWQATEVIKILTGVGEPLKGRLLTVDLLTNRINHFGIKTITANKTIESLTAIAEECTANGLEISSSEFQQWRMQNDVQLIDVREIEEYNLFNIGGKHIALSHLQDHLDEIDPSKRTVVFCQSGVRSKKAIPIIQQKFPQLKIYNLKGGLKALD